MYEGRHWEESAKFYFFSTAWLISVIPWRKLKMCAVIPLKGVNFNFIPYACLMALVKIGNILIGNFDLWFCQKSRYKIFRHSVTKIQFWQLTVYQCQTCWWVFFLQSYILGSVILSYFDPFSPKFGPFSLKIGAFHYFWSVFNQKSSFGMKNFQNRKIATPISGFL